ncbi:hypothetical protein PSTT_04288 [Puccinia striiformis]|uniref:Uncharacterized protein n=1 Tax=Puccinia striiformis TaxID=27350 RepID=A0A2S4VSV3_9BASI|nr:hypothetical protein PSTT_04288 [Puccinia striiformis]
MTLAVDLLNPSAEQERRKHKLKRLVQALTPTSWMSSVLVVSTSPQSSHTPKPLFSADHAPPSSASLPVEKLV